MVGPFIFFDHMGPASSWPGSGIDVRPHPHIGLATVTYLFEGEIVHRDSLGSMQAIRPGDVNWMTAGRGIVHSERTTADAAPPAARACTACRSGWRCRARTRRPSRPSPTTRPPTLPLVESDGRAAARARRHRLRRHARRSRRCRRPVLRRRDLARRRRGRAARAEHEERAVYVARGRRRGRRPTFAAGPMLVVPRPATPSLLRGGRRRAGHAPRRRAARRRSATSGGTSSPARKERIEQAKRDWKEGRFPQGARRRDGVHPAAGAALEGKVASMVKPCSRGVGTPLNSLLLSRVCQQGSISVHSRRSGDRGLRHPAL